MQCPFKKIQRLTRRGRTPSRGGAAGAAGGGGTDRGGEAGVRAVGGLVREEAVVGVARGAGHGRLGVHAQLGHGPEAQEQRAQLVLGGGVRQVAQEQLLRVAVAHLAQLARLARLAVAIVTRLALVARLALFARVALVARLTLVARLALVAVVARLATVAVVALATVT